MFGFRAANNARTNSAGGNVGNQDGLRHQLRGGKNIGLTGIPRSSWLPWEKLSLGAYPSGVQRGNIGNGRQPLTSGIASPAAAASGESEFAKVQFYGGRS